MLESRKKRFYSRLRQKQQKAGATGDLLDQFGSTVRYDNENVPHVSTVQRWSKSRIYMY